MNGNKRLTSPTWRETTNVIKKLKQRNIGIQAQRHMKNMLILS